MSSQRPATDLDDENLADALAGGDLTEIADALLSGAVLVPLTVRPDGSTVPRLAGQGDNRALPGFSSLAALRGWDAEAERFTRIPGRQWAALARDKNLFGVLDPAGASFALDTRLVDQLADGFVPGVHGGPAHLAAVSQRHIREATGDLPGRLERAAPAAGVRAQVVEMSYGGPFRPTLVVLDGDPAAAARAVQPHAPAGGMDVLEADEPLRTWLEKRTDDSATSRRRGTHRRLRRGVSGPPARGQLAGRPRPPRRPHRPGSPRRFPWRPEPPQPQHPSSWRTTRQSAPPTWRSARATRKCSAS